MSRQIQIRRGTATDHSNFTGAMGEVTMDTTNKTLRVHDGVTVGGNEIMSVNRFNANITNCIINIPQDIKVSYSGSDLTIQAGSKIYYPNGTGTFSSVVLENDETFSVSGTGTLFVFRRNAPGTSGYWADVPSDINSGIPDSSTSGVFYDTTNNRIDWYVSGTRADRLFSFPVCKIIVSNGLITEIEQVFNGFGFVGSTVYVLPGVKGLIPDGRNGDGTLRNLTVLINSVKTSVAVSSKYMMNSAGISPALYTNYAEQESKPSFANGEWYKPSENIMYGIVEGNVSKYSIFYAFELIVSGGKVTRLTPKNPVRLADYNDTDLFAHQSMPSNRYIDLTLGASGTSYVAPADGYYTITKQASSVGQYVYLRAEGTNEINVLNSASNTLVCRTFLPVQKGTRILVTYTADSTTYIFRFIYANGAK